MYTPPSCTLEGLKKKANFYFLKIPDYLTTVTHAYTFRKLLRFFQTQNFGSWYCMEYLFFKSFSFERSGGCI